MKRICRILVALCAVTPVWVAAQQPASELDNQALRDAQEHARITAQREQTQARAAEAEAACYQRFAVNGCLGKVRSERREVLSDLRRQEIALNDAARKRRAADQLLRIDERAREAATR
jgi:colicin import membrane protein